MLSSDFCQGLPRGSSAPPGGLPEQDGNDDEDDDAMHEECGFVMFCAFSVMYKKKKNSANKETKTRFQLQTGFCKFEFPQSGSAVLREREVEARGSQNCQVTRGHGQQRKRPRHTHSGAVVLLAQTNKKKNCFSVIFFLSSTFNV